MLDCVSQLYLHRWCFVLSTDIYGISYTEAVDVIYVYSAFDFNYLETFEAFATRVPANHLNTIRCLILNVYLTQDCFRHRRILLESTKLFVERWEKSCETLAGMQGLLELRIKAHFGPGFSQNRDGDQNEEIWFWPLVRLGKKDLKVFEVEVDWPALANSRGVDGSLPFQLRRRVWGSLEG